MSNKTTLQTNNTNLASYSDRVAALINVANSLPEAGGEQATPEISVNSNGLITAVAGTKSATKQLTIQAAKTITPTTASQIAVSSGYYTGGSVTVKGDANLVASNIKSGVSIFGISGTYAGGGSGGSTDIEDAFVTKTLTTYENSRVSSIGKYAFYGCYNLKTASFPECTTIGSYAFVYCSSLTTISFPKCTTIRNSAFVQCSSLTTVSFPKCTTIENYAFDMCYNLKTASFPECTTIGSAAFRYCSSLTTISFPKCTTIRNSAFDQCYNLKTVSFPECTTIGSSVFRYCSSLSSIYLMSTSICSLINSNAFFRAGIGSNKGSIFVPSSLVTSYKAATNWTYFSNRIYSYIGVPEHTGGSDE